MHQPISHRSRSNQKNKTQTLDVYVGFHKWGYPNSWMLYKGISNIKMDDSEVPPFLETPIDVIYIYIIYRYMPFTIAIKICHFS